MGELCTSFLLGALAVVCCVSEVAEEKATLCSCQGRARARDGSGAVPLMQLNWECPRRALQLHPAPVWAAAGQANGRMSPEMGQMNDGVIPILGVSVRLLVKKSRFWYLGKK